MLFTVHQHGPPTFLGPKSSLSLRHWAQRVFGVRPPGHSTRSCLSHGSVTVEGQLLVFVVLTRVKEETIGWRYRQQVTSSQSPFGLTISRQAVCGGCPW